MEEYKVWKVIEKSSMPRDRRLVKCKWVFLIKNNGVFRSRLVACGYSQIPGIDFADTYSPVIHDSTFKVLLILLMMMNLDYLLIDVETAFLTGNLEDVEIYMECPEGMQDSLNKCLFLLKATYGLVQASRSFFLKLVKKLKGFGFEQSKADPCLMIKRSNKGLVILALYVDDILCIGNKDAIQDTVEKLKKVFTIKVTTSLSDYLSCEILFDKYRKRAWIGQPHLIKKLESKFGEYARDAMLCKTPGTPNQGVIRPTEDSKLIPSEEQTRYRSGVGMLLYLVKHSRPDIANAVRELSKCMDKATQQAVKELKRVIRFVLATKDYGLKLSPNGSLGKWSVNVYSDSDWAGDKDTRLSVTGFVIFLMGSPIMWRSRAQRSVSLSSTEAEYYALSEAAKEVKFVAQVLITMGLEVKLPIVVRVDNVGAIFMSENANASSRTRHADIRYRFVTSFIEDKFIKVVFVKSHENVSDGFTKNVNAEIYEEHKKHYLAERKEYSEMP